MGEVIKFVPKKDSEPFEGLAKIRFFKKNKIVIGRVCPKCKYAATQKAVGLSKKNLDCPKCGECKISEFLPYYQYGDKE